MHDIYELKDMLCGELSKYGSKGDLSAGELEIVDKLAHAVKNLGKIIEMEDEEYSGNYYNNDGMSYRDGRGGSYARGRGSNAKRDSMGRYSRYSRYSRDGGYSRAEDMASQLREMMEDAPDAQTKNEIKRLAKKMEMM